MSPGASDAMVVITRAPPRPTFSAIVRSSCSTVPSVPMRRTTKFTKMSSRVTRRLSDGVGVGIAPAAPGGTMAGRLPVGAASAGTPTSVSWWALRSASAISAALANRSARFLARALRSTGTAASGMRAATGPSKGTGSWMCLNSVATGVSPRKGTVPVKISYTAMPSA